MFLKDKITFCRMLYENGKRGCLMLTLGQTLDLCIIIIGFASAVYFGKSALVLKSNTILLLTSSESNSMYSGEQVKAMADQKTNSLIAAFYLILLFCLQLVKIYIQQDYLVTEIIFYSFLGGIIILLMIGSLFYDYYYNKTVYQVNLLKGYKYCQQIFEKDYDNINDIINNIKWYSGLIKYPDETNIDLIKRFSHYVGFKISKDADLSKFK
jgi:hypothetical protein